MRRDGVAESEGISVGDGSGPDASAYGAARSGPRHRRGPARSRSRRSSAWSRVLFVVMFLGILGATVMAIPRADGSQAAVAHGWGPVVGGDEFDAGLLDQEKWLVYDGAGHDGKGVRSPGRVSVSDGVLTVRGDAAGTTGGLAMWPGRRYGRWEARMRVPAGHPDYHAVLVLWPDSNVWPGDGEVDYAEMTADADEAQFNFLAGPTNTWVRGATKLDITAWHNYAVEWSPTGMRGYVDGMLVFEDTDVTHLPPGPMHQTIQLDWIPYTSELPTESSMEVDWVRMYALTDQHQP